MMRYIVEINTRKNFPDTFGRGVVADSKSLGIHGINMVQTSPLFFLSGDIPHIKTTIEQYLIDPIVQNYALFSPHDIQNLADRSLGWDVVVTLKSGVTDTAAENIERILGFTGSKKMRVRTGIKYSVFARGNAYKKIKYLADKLLTNGVIHDYFIQKRSDIYGENLSTFFNKQFSSPATEAPSQSVSIPILKTSDETLQEISTTYLLALSLPEMKAVQKYFRRLKRDPSDIELETIAQTWSEHCVHKTFKAKINYKEEGHTEKIDGLFQSYIVKATKEVHKPWIVSAFVDNAGIIKFDDTHDVSFKVETHNHPSALEPFGGANTGVGGVIRDILAVSAKPIANTDVLCFGELNQSFLNLPKNVLHPKRVYSGVVGGVRDYGNKMGIPTVSGAVLFDKGYTLNPLVFCGTVGIAPRKSHPTSVSPGDLVVMVGGRVGRDGIHGVAFASEELKNDISSRAGSVVQIGNPITEKKLLDCILKARDLHLYEAICDCGGGGLSSAVGEMGKSTGVWVELDTVPLKYKGLSPWEIWISEAQERMVLAVDPKKIKKILPLFAREDVEATVIGKFTDDHVLTLVYQRKKIGELSMEFLHHGLPQRKLHASYVQKTSKSPSLPLKPKIAILLKKILADPNVASKESILRTYDHEVGGGTVLKPLVGKFHQGPSDASVIKPLISSSRGVVISCGINPRLGSLDPYAMAATAIDEAIRNAIAVGGNLSHMAILDNFCWGNPTFPDRLGALVKAVKACYDTARGFGVPFISGKDSLYNEYKDSRTGKSISIPPTLLISAISVIPDVAKIVSMDFKAVGNPIYIVGKTYEELGGCYYLKILEKEGGRAPSLDVARARKSYMALSSAIAQGHVRSCHDLSEGGLAVALAESALAGAVGAQVDLALVPYQGGRRDDSIIFSESNTRFIVEVDKKYETVFTSQMQGIPMARIGQTIDGTRLKVRGIKGTLVISEELDSLQKAWQTPLL